jgi:hypothetical protein
VSVRSKSIKKGDWRTLETFWNVTTTVFFKEPGGVQIRLRYSAKPFPVNRQTQTLDGRTEKRIVVSKWSIFAARVQAHTKVDTNITYILAPGNVANSAKIKF